MVRRPPRLLAGLATALVLAAGLPVGLPAAPGHASPPTPADAAPKNAEYDPPLEVSIDALTPGVLPRSGPLVISGTVTNVDLDTWQRVNLYPMFGSTAPPMTAEKQLASAIATDPEAEVGQRYTEDLEVRAEVASLGPGESAEYTIRIPQRVLRLQFPNPTTGVYWFGVHALGENADGRDTLADGRARTFLPYVAPGAGQAVDTAIVVPLRGRVAHSADGELGRTSWWDAALSPEGSLGGPLAFGAAGGTTPMTWLVDPAVPDAVSQLASGNPVREIAPAAPAGEPSGSESPSPSESQSGDDDAGEGGDDAADVGNATLEPDSPLVRSAQSWMRNAGTLLPDDTVAVLPYGDPDLAAAARALPSLYGTARKHPTATLDAWGVEGTPVVASRNGYLDAAAIGKVDDDATVLLGDQVFGADAFPDGPPAGPLVGDRPVVPTSTATARGGPGPDPALAPVALRQRLLSEATVRILAAGDERPAPLAVVLPSSIDAAGADEFWTGLDPALVRPVDLPTLTRTDELAADPGDPGRQVDPDDLTYPEGQVAAQLDASVLDEAGALIRSGRSLQSILGEEYTIGTTLVGEALAGTSYAMRDDADAAPRLARSRSWVSDQLDKVSIDAPQGVTLSSSSGSFNVAIRNTLDHAVTVRIEAATDSDATIKAANPIVLAANSRSSVPISADMHGTGVHNVRLRLTDADGTPIGAEDQLPIRSGQVGVVIWAIIGTGAGILFVAIGIRLVRRFRASRGDGMPDDADEVTA
ncbi:DUF6049 family protein [Nocardioides daeguensis]|uniref:DUF6049 family protein n=1 Tax=Nocardioides daeguensis TaxID=908359 RepID=A0ABP6WAP3_9ACTN|nr:DUF6049 family protein [Nocardioides daeguensis]MBV6728113.1 hypothetical protein [Nocardioides daeguensis]MCR1774187.1 hypothetical protein [Nocardioides daeguensis]